MMQWLILIDVNRVYCASSFQGPMGQMGAGDRKDLIGGPLGQPSNMSELQKLVNMQPATLPPGGGGLGLYHTPAGPGGDPSMRPAAAGKMPPRLGQTFPSLTRPNDSMACINSQTYTTSALQSHLERFPHAAGIPHAGVSQTGIPPRAGLPQTGIPRDGVPPLGDFPHGRVSQAGIPSSSAQVPPPSGESLEQSVSSSGRDASLTNTSTDVGPSHIPRSVGGGSIRPVTSKYTGPPLHIPPPPGTEPPTSPPQGNRPSTFPHVPPRPGVQSPHAPQPSVSSAPNSVPTSEAEKSEGPNKRSTDELKSSDPSESKQSTSGSPKPESIDSKATNKVEISDPIVSSGLVSSSSTLPSAVPSVDSQAKSEKGLTEKVKVEKDGTEKEGQKDAAPGASPQHGSALPSISSPGGQQQGIKSPPQVMGPPAPGSTSPRPASRGSPAASPSRPGSTGIRSPRSPAAGGHLTPPHQSALCQALKSPSPASSSLAQALKSPTSPGKAMKSPQSPGKLSDPTSPASSGGENRTMYPTSETRMPPTALHRMTDSRPITSTDPRYGPHEGRFAPYPGMRPGMRPGYGENRHFFPENRMGHYPDGRPMTYGEHRPGMYADARHGPYPQARFGYHGERFPPPNVRFGPHGEFGPHFEGRMVGPHGDRRFPMHADGRYGPYREGMMGPDNRYGPHAEARFGPHAEQRFFPHGEGRFGPQADARFGPQGERFGPHVERFGLQAERFGPQADRYGPGPHGDMRFGPPGPTQPGFPHQQRPGDYMGPRPGGMQPTGNASPRLHHPGTPPHHGMTTPPHLPTTPPQASPHMTLPSLGGTTPPQGLPQHATPPHISQTTPPLSTPPMQGRTNATPSPMSSSSTVSSSALSAHLTANTSAEKDHMTADTSTNQSPSVPACSGSLTQVTARGQGHSGVARSHEGQQRRPDSLPLSMERFEGSELSASVKHCSMPLYSSERLQ